MDHLVDKKQQEIRHSFEVPDPQYKCQYHSKSKGPDPHNYEPRSLPKKIFNNVLEMIGNTPLVRLKKIPQAEGLRCEILASCEFLNPGGSSKDRVGWRMVFDTQKQGKIKPGDTLVEPTSGNTGIGMALAAITYGYNLIFTMPEKISEEKADLLRALGGKVHRAPSELDHDHPDSYAGIALRLSQQPNHYMLNQYINPPNALAHYDATAEELIEQCDGKIDYVVIAAGTGGTITGIGRKIREKMPNCKIVAVDPVGSLQALPGTLNGPAGSFKIEGIGNDYIPMVMDRSVVDYWVKTDDQESFEMARRLIREEGLLVGGSSGTTLAGVIKFAKEHNLGEGVRIVFSCPDGARNYISKFVSTGWMIDNGFTPVSSLKDPSHPLNNISWRILNLKSLRLFDDKLTIGDALEALNEGNEIVPILKEGVLFKIINQTHLCTKIASKKLKKSDLAIWEGTRDFAAFEEQDLDLAQLEQILRRNFVVIIRERDPTTKSISALYAATSSHILPIIISKMTK